MARGIDEKRQCMQGIGYKEVAEGLRLGSSDEEIAEAVKRIPAITPNDRLPSLSVCKIIRSFLRRRLRRKRY